MDKLRSLQYFVATAEESSFSAAARRMNVSAAAVAKLVAALERNLGVRLLERHAHGVTMTAAGSSYFEASRTALDQLVAADEQARAATTRPRGVVVAGVQPVIAQEILTPALPRFRSMYPEIELDVRYFMRITEEQTRGVDVFLAMGWPQAGELVQRRVGAVTFGIYAAPSYWAAHGMPQHPSELAQHNCLCIRNNMGPVMDLWHFRRGDETVSVSVRGWLLVDNAHREIVRESAIAGAGVARLLDWSKLGGRRFNADELVPALAGWESTEVPPISVLYPPSVRRIQRVKLFIDFVAQLLRDNERRTPMTTPRPHWLQSMKSRASTTRARRL